MPTLNDHSFSSDRALAPLLRASLSSSTLGSRHSDDSDAPSDPSRRQKAHVRRILAFVSSVVAAICAGSVTVFSLYGHIFQSRLHYSQFQINGVASTMSISLYILVPLVGYMCDRVGPGPLSLLSAVLFALGYGLAAGLFKKGVETVAAGGSGTSTYPAMIFAFFCIGTGTACMYLSAITTCAKNFGKGRYRGLLLVAPIAGFGLSGVLLSQIGSGLLWEAQPDGSKGDVNVFHFFLFLCILQSAVGVIGTFTLRIVDEDDLIEGAYDELERSGFLEGSDLLRRRSDRSYGALEGDSAPDETAAMLNPNKDDDNIARLRKVFVLNAETRRFLTDHTMWWFALGFLFIIGPGESFINNLGTVIGTLYSPLVETNTTSAATHVSIMAAVSTVARLLAASLSDLLSPSPQSQYVQTGAVGAIPALKRKLSVSRVTLFVGAALILSVGTVVLASGAVQGHGDRFWIISSAVGAGYGAVFSLTPIIITMIWGVENFGTNFGIVALTPAIGSTFWGLIYSANYQTGAANSTPVAADGSQDDVLCYGKQCYAGTYWAETACIWVGAAMVLWAWKGRGGWEQRGIVI